jgi:uncharacterized protein YqjF (DUF2071 family)
MASRPAPFLTATWHNIVLLSYEVDPGVLVRYLPRGVELDTWDDKYLISIVGLQFRHTRVLGVPVPFHRSYPQVNLRFYVCRRAGGQWRPGVVFIRQIVPRKLVALVARRAYQEKFMAAPVRLSVETDPDVDRFKKVSYQWFSHPAWNHMSVAVSGEPELSGVGSLEEFIVERYYGYNQRRDGSTLEFHIEHPRWRIWRAEGPELLCDVARLYGTEFVQGLSGTPVSAFAAEGSEAAVYQGVRLDVHSV